jgi:hypothetical protein
MNKKLICGALFFAIAVLTQAQQHAPGGIGAAIPMARPAMAVPAPMAHAAPAGSGAANRSASSTRANASAAGHSSTRNTSRPGTGTRPNKYPPRPVNPNFVNGTNFVDGAGFADEIPVPGLGFDYAHFFAVHPNWQREHPSTGVFPFVGGGLYLPAPYYEANAAGNEPAESTNDSATAAAVPQESNEDANPREAEPASTRARTGSNSAPANTTEYVFVRRDGTVFFAVAYSWVNGRLQYITQDGLRKIASVDSLDLKATQEFNEQSGQMLTTPSL